MTKWEITNIVKLQQFSNTINLALQLMTNMSEIDFKIYLTYLTTEHFVIPDNRYSRGDIHMGFKKWIWWSKSIKDKKVIIKCSDDIRAYTIGYFPDNSRMFDIEHLFQDITVMNYDQFIKN